MAFEEYRSAVKYLQGVAAAGEIPLLCDVFFNTTICDIENRNFGGTPSPIEGPYYLKNAPIIPNGGTLKRYERDNGEPLMLRGSASRRSRIIVPSAAKPVAVTKPVAVKNSGVSFFPL